MSSFQKRKHKKSKLLKSKSVTKERIPTINQADLGGVEEKHEALRSAALKASDLKDGLRLLILQEGKFWPARLNSTKLPDVWGLVMDRQRGNRPIILPRDDILKEAVSDQMIAMRGEVETLTNIMCSIQSYFYQTLLDHVSIYPKNLSRVHQLLIYDFFGH